MLRSYCNTPISTVKAQTVVVSKALTLGVILSIGLLGSVAEAKKNTPPVTTPAPVYQGDDLNDAGAGWAEEIVRDTADNKADRDRLATVPPDSPLARQIQRDIAQRGEKAESYAERAPTSVPVLTAAADQALGNGDVARAQGRADQAVNAAATETDPKKFAEKWPLAMNTRGQVAKAMEDYPTANAYALKVLEKFPKDPNALALYHETKGRAKGGAVLAAPASGQAAAPMSTPNPYNDPRYKELGQRLARVNALNGEAASKLRMGDGNEALRLALAAQAIEPTGKSFILEARAWMVLDKLADAIDRMGKAIDLLKKNGSPEVVADAYGERARLQNLTGKKENAQGAINDANEALKIDVENAPALRERGLAYETQGDLAAAEADLRRAAEFDPTMRSDVDEFYKRKANGFSGAVVQVEEEGALHKAWTGLLGRAGGGFKLFVGTMGALFVLFGGYVLFFAKENSPMRNMSRFFTPWNNKMGALLDDAAAPLENADMPRTINSQFELRRVIGEGGMGKVYGGWDSKLNRPVAIKCLRAELQTSPRERERFVKEARTVALLQHPHIVQIFTIIEEGEQTYIVYEHIEGRTLHEELNETPGRRLGPRRALEFLRQIAGAVDHAHERKIIHRDLKPSNVMMTRVGGKDWLKVMDFGIARQVQDALAQTNTNTIVGTPIYMAPEQSVGLVTKQSDVFALGVTLYETLTGSLPFKNKNDPMERWNEGSVYPASSLLPILLPAIDAVIAKALAPKHENRYQSCMEFYAAAEDALRQVVTPT